MNAIVSPVPITYRSEGMQDRSSFEIQDAKKKHYTKMKHAISEAIGTTYDGSVWLYESQCCTNALMTVYLEEKGEEKNKEAHVVLVLDCLDDGKTLRMPGNASNIINFFGLVNVTIVSNCRSMNEEEMFLFGCLSLTKLELYMPFVASMSSHWLAECPQLTDLYLLHLGSLRSVAPGWCNGCVCLKQIHVTSASLRASCTIQSPSFVDCKLTFIDANINEPQGFLRLLPCRVVMQGTLHSDEQAIAIKNLLESALREPTNAPFRNANPCFFVQRKSIAFGDKLCGLPYKLFKECKIATVSEEEKEAKKGEKAEKKGVKSVGKGGKGEKKGVKSVGKEEKDDGENDKGGSGKKVKGKEKKGRGSAKKNTGDGENDGVEGGKVLKTHKNKSKYTRKNITTLAKTAIQDANGQKWYDTLLTDTPIYPGQSKYFAAADIPKILRQMDTCYHDYTQAMNKLTYSSEVLVSSWKSTDHENLWKDTLKKAWKLNAIAHKLRLCRKLAVYIWNHTGIGNEEKFVFEREGKGESLCGYYAQNYSFDEFNLPPVVLFNDGTVELVNKALVEKILSSNVTMPQTKDYIYALVPDLSPMGAISTCCTSTTQHGDFLPINFDKLKITFEGMETVPVPRNGDYYQTYGIHFNPVPAVSAVPSAEAKAASDREKHDALRSNTDESDAHMRQELLLKRKKPEMTPEQLQQWNDL
jgi:hypothetical protein